MMEAASDKTVAAEGTPDAFSPANIILAFHHTVKYLLSKWLVLIVSGLALGLIYIAYASSKKPVYTADLSFAMDDGAVKSTTSNSFSSLSEELGFGPTYEAGGVFSSVANIMELLQSRLIIEKTLKRSVSMNGKPILYIDFFLDSLDFRRKWMEGSPYEKYNFLKSKVSADEGRFANGIINNIYSLLTASYIKVDKKGKGGTLIQVSLTTQNEAFSKYFLEALIAEVSQYYTELKTQRARIHLDFIQRRTDSTRGSYSGNLYSRAAVADANINPAREITAVPADRKLTDVQVSKEAYTSLVKSLEAAKTSLMEETPLFQYLDTPVFPLKVSPQNKWKNFFLLFIAGILMTAVFLIFRRFYLSVVKPPLPDTDGDELAV